MMQVVSFNKKRVRFIRVAAIGSGATGLVPDSAVLDFYTEGTWFPDPIDLSVLISPTAVLSVARVNDRGYTAKDLELFRKQGLH